MTLEMHLKLASTYYCVYFILFVIINRIIEIQLKLFTKKPYLISNTKIHNSREIFKR